MNSFRILAAALSLVILSTANVNAQTRIVLTGGVNFAQVDGDNFSVWPGVSTSGFSTGLAAIIPTQGDFEFEFRGAYSRRGRESSYSEAFSYDGASWYNDSIRTARVVSGNHLGLMALGRVSLPWAANGLHTYVAAGPALSWQLSCHVKYTIFETNISWITPGTTTSNCTGRDRLDFALAGALGLEYRMAEEMGFTLGTEYTHGIRNLTKALAQGRGESARSRVVTIRAGLVYRIG